MRIGAALLSSMGVIWLLAPPGPIRSVATAADAPPTITEFSAGITPGAAFGGITAGPDGNVWFTEPGFDKIGKITPTGVVSEYAVGPENHIIGLNGITRGPDGNVWFTGTVGDGSPQGTIGKITPSGMVTQFSSGISAGFLTICITAGGDGNLWFTETGGSSDHVVSQVGRITPAGSISEYPSNSAGEVVPHSIAGGPDGNVWFAASSHNVSRITPSGSITSFPFEAPDYGGYTENIASGPDGNMWFNDEHGQLVRILTAAPNTITKFPTDTRINHGARDVASGPDGNLWFTEPEATGNSGIVGRMTPTGSVSLFTQGITPDAYLHAITAGPDGNVWFAEDAGRIGRIDLGGKTAAMGSPSSANSGIAASSASVGGAGGTVAVTATFRDTANRPFVNDLVNFTLQDGPPGCKVTFDPASTNTDPTGTARTNVTIPGGCPGVFTVAASKPDPLTLTVQIAESSASGGIRGPPNTGGASPMPVEDTDG